MCQTCGSDDAAGQAEQAVDAALRIRHFHLILADIAIAAAVKGLGHADLAATGEQDYVPGAVRDRWQEIAPDDAALRRVNQLANAGLASLQQQGAEQLAASAARYGIPLSPAIAADIAGHFSGRRDAVMTYDR
ncbi:hypothetical protein OOZ54_06790 [Rhodopseudomonas palustris]|uniref:hypothetical protein n=1 Tax=Rhodopseudomonas palustris TaxID=1076 RepID=UPI0022F0BFEE|nr:hypothetical protein [Rhodopseudomonas palustris]WBU31194.1 hypothetical protein OOZ54_06790 [Rhodopseudomonas palustris]